MAAAGIVRTVRAAAHRRVPAGMVLVDSLPVGRALENRIVRVEVVSRSSCLLRRAGLRCRWGRRGGLVGGSLVVDLRAVSICLRVSV